MLIPSAEVDPPSVSAGRVTIGWTAIEAAVAVASGTRRAASRWPPLGLDSVIELASRGVRIRAVHRLEFGREAPRAPKKPPCGSPGADCCDGKLFVVAVGWSLWRGGGEAFSGPDLPLHCCRSRSCSCWHAASSPSPISSGSAALRADAADLWPASGCSSSS